MGLDIYYESLDEYLAEQFDSSALVRRARLAIEKEISRQARRKIVLPVEKRRATKIESDRYGPYSAIHALRFYASRVAGYTLEEAYALPQTRINFLQTKLANDRDDDGDSDDVGSNQLELDLAQEWGTTPEILVPLSRRKRKPFPYMNLVCFSDTSGIFIPVSFSQPFLLDDLYIGSSLKLLEELKAVGKFIADDIITTLQSPNETREEFLLLVRQLWTPLEFSCRKSQKTQVSMIFG